MILGESQRFASSEEALRHFGVKGMHWGVRKERAKNLQPLIKADITRTTSNGDQFTLAQSPPGKIQKALAAASQNYANRFGTQAYLSIKDKNGKKIGDINFWNDGKDTLYINWITVKKSARGHGYASAVMRSAEEHARTAGMKRMTLEVPGNSPDARHIYEKMGFKVTHEPTPKEAKNDPMWGGLTEMEKKLD